MQRSSMPLAVIPVALLEASVVLLEVVGLLVALREAAALARRAHCRNSSTEYERELDDESVGARPSYRKKCMRPDHARDEDGERHGGS